MLRLLVRDQDVSGIAGRVGDAVGNRSVAGRLNVRASYPGVCRAQEGRGKVCEPVWVKISIDLACGRFKASIARIAQTAILSADQPEAILSRNGRRRVSRSIVNDDHFAIWILQLQQAFKAVPDGALPVVTADNHRDRRPVEVWWERRVSKCVAHGSKRWLRSPVTASETEIPVCNFGIASEPLVGPGKHKGAGAAGRKRCSNLPVEHTGLRVFAMSVAVQPDLGHNQGPVARDVM